MKWFNQLGKRQRQTLSKFKTMNCGAKPNEIHRNMNRNCMHIFSPTAKPFKIKNSCKFSNREHSDSSKKCWKTKKGTFLKRISRLICDVFFEHFESMNANRETNSQFIRAFRWSMCSKSRWWMADAGSVGTKSGARLCDRVEMSELVYRGHRVPTSKRLCEAFPIQTTILMIVDRENSSTQSFRSLLHSAQQWARYRARALKWNSLSAFLLISFVDAIHHAVRLSPCRMMCELKCM